MALAAGILAWTDIPIRSYEAPSLPFRSPGCRLSWPPNNITRESDQDSTYDLSTLAVRRSTKNGDCGILREKMMSSTHAWASTMLPLALATVSRRHEHFDGSHFL